MRKGLCLAVLLLSAAVAHGGTIQVPGDYTLLQAALDAAVSGDTVLVAAGTYDSLFYPPGADTARCVAYMKTGVTLLGAGMGQTVIDAQNQGRGILCYGVSSGRIEGLTVINAFSEITGAGIFCTQGSSPTIAGCEVKECGDGGIICTFASNPLITDCVIKDNIYKSGGGIAIEDGASPTVVNTLIYRNRAPEAGGVLVRGAGSSGLFINCVIDSNYLNASDAPGGGFAVRDGGLTVRNCRVTRNRATGAGGGFDIRSAGSPVVIDSTIIADNSTADAFGPGGGLYMELSDLELTFCEITGNSAPGTDSLNDGGGIFAFLPSSMTMTNCTVADNSTRPLGRAGGIYCWFANPTIEKSILAFNHLKGIHCEDSTPILSCTDIYGNDNDALCGTDNGGNFSANPGFCDRPNGDYTLAGTSPCLPGNHPDSEPCGLIGAYGVGTCAIGVADGSGAESMIPFDHQASPNPFGPSTTIRFGMTNAGRASVAIYNIQGRRVRMFEEGELAAGPHQVSWDGRDDSGRALSSGVYFYRVTENGRGRSGRLVLTR
ncbi:MAG: right-handed parallel beta-helix repeat-containing protein [Candidatus Eisenbacteria bacterium]